MIPFELFAKIQTTLGTLCQRREVGRMEGCPENNK